MLARLGQVLCGLTIVLSLSVNAAENNVEVWDCSYMSSDIPLERNTQFRVDDDALVGNTGERYTILENDDAGIVAVFSYSYPTNPTGTQVGGYVVIIEKQSGQLFWTKANVHELENGVFDTFLATSRGRCSQADYDTPLPN